MSLETCAKEETCQTSLSTEPIAGDEYSGLATLLANLIAKYADQLVFDDDQPPESADSSPTAAQGDPSRASLLFSVALMFAA